MHVFIESTFHKHDLVISHFKLFSHVAILSAMTLFSHSQSSESYKKLFPPTEFSPMYAKRDIRCPVGKHVVPSFGLD